MERHHRRDEPPQGGLRPLDLHTVIYGDRRHVANARSAAMGRIASRTIYAALVESWAAPVAGWLARHLRKIL